ncbi:MAG: FtsK/SpoIIIE domain-containing protein [Patescibacteria group bacterium]|nr:FtsK/SpoIIIE domain-containing protein [Patescibacteria group bacterium]MDD5121140.1 FtsK/SpoIIIE domain-containing protein [Patescibacteria group bacterium]MDD5221655.1 FtsK/SpoIIIE domain-containing protein [Patescibacteria group bacterium]MDD5395941.1 FtsK/SpoIIIE domain-containing protein [Patescibacteria group bacterium]
MIYPRKELRFKGKPALAKDLWKHKEFGADKKNLVVPLGVRVGKRFSLSNLLWMVTNKKYLFLDLKDLPHLIIGGNVNSPTNEYTNAIMVSLIKKFTPKELQFVIADSSYIDYAFFSESSYLKGPFLRNAEELLKATDETVKELDRRYDILREARMRTADKYNNEKSFEMPHLFLIIDEMAKFMLEDAKTAKAIEKNLIRILQLGRCVNIRLIINAWYFKEEVLPILLRVNFTTKICFATISKEDTEFIFDYGGAEKLELGYEALLTNPYIGEKGPIKFRVALVSDEDIYKIAHQTQ